jgi:hypothetical protein
MIRRRWLTEALTAICWQFVQSAARPGAGRRQKPYFADLPFPTKSGAADDASAAAISRVWGHTQVGTIVFVTN